MRANPVPRLLAILLLLLIAAGVSVPGVHAVVPPDAVSVAPPQAAVDASDVVAQQTASAQLSLVREAFDLILGSFVFPIPSNVLLSDAVDGMNNALKTAGLPALVKPALSGDVDADWKAFASGFRLVASSGAIDPTTLAYGAINQMAVARNSCHTFFLPPTLAVQDVGSSNHQPTVDVGFVPTRGDNVVVTRVYPGGPAEQADLRPGDTILTSAGMGSPGIFRRIELTKPGQPVEITVQRPGVAQPITLSLVPAITVLPFVRTQVLPGGIGVIQLDDVTTGAGLIAAIRQALTDFEAQGVVGWVLDLRTSPGGEAHTMSGVASLFLQSGHLLTEIDRAGGQIEVDADGSAFPVQRPLVILTEHFTASAGEFLPGILQDDGRAYVIGDTTVGCISSARFTGLADGSAIQIEANQVLLGNDRLNLNGVGVTPNETIVRTPEILASGDDPQLDRAVQYLLSVAGQ